MADQGKKDTSDYSATKAPETRQHAEEQAPDDPTDWRLIPGGRHGSPELIGMDALHRGQLPGRAEKPAEKGENDPIS